MLTSKEVLDRTGISRATLNNYIASGLVAKPQVLPPGPDDGDAPRIGYFADDVVARIEEIQRLKQQGMSLASIAQRLAGQPGAGPASAPAPAEVARTSLSAAAAAQPMPPPAGTQAATAAYAPMRVPGLTDVAVMVSELDRPHRIWAALAPAEYFELVNQVWTLADPIVRRHQGVQGRHGADGIVCYFFPRSGSSHTWGALQCALEIRDALVPLSHEWQARKGWPMNVCFNTGVDEGREWLGHLRSASRPEFAGLAATLRRAARIAGAAPPGAVLAAKNLVLRLSREEQAQLLYGIRQRDAAGGESVSASLFAPAASVATSPAPGDVPDALAVIPITEIIDIAPGAAAR